MRVITFVVTMAVSLVLSFVTAPTASATFSPTPVGPVGWVPDGPVHAIVPAGNRVYVGGAFTGGLVAVNPDNGALIWRSSFNGDVRALAVSADGTHVIAGGAFTAAGGVTHRKLASVVASNGSVEPRWKATAGGTVRDIVVRGDTAYFAGLFRNHNGIAQRGLGAVSVSTGKAVTGFRTTTDGKVYGLATDGSRLVIAGDFTTVDGRARNSLASVSLAAHTLDDWAPARQCSGCNLWWDVLVDSGRVYVAGRNASAVTALDFATGARRWRVTANGDAQAMSLALHDGRLYVGGHFVEIGDPRQSRTILAALDPADGSVESFSAKFVTTWPGIWALATTQTRLYVGGHFTAAGPTPPKKYPYFAVFAAV